MNKINAVKKALEQAFWITYPSLHDSEQYTFEELFPTLKSSEYQDIFWQLVEANELPLIPVIPLENGGTVTRFALDFY
jgi:hypothetical protein